MEKDTSIQTLHLSKRSYNVLKKFKIKTNIKYLKQKGD